jgi:KinB signaling pathway activation protein
MTMTLKKLLYWFWTTLLVGSVSALVLGFTLEMATGKDLFGPIPKQLILSLTLGAVTELGFFSYLVFNWLAKGLFRNKRAYDFCMLALVVLVMGDLVYFNLSKYNGESLWMHLLPPFLVLLAGMIVAGLKAKLTQKSAYVPTLFFMVVATVMEAVPSFNAKAGEIPLLLILHTVLVLLICNAWQILQLHRLVSVGTVPPVDQTKNTSRKSPKQKPASSIK